MLKAIKPKSVKIFSVIIALSLMFFSFSVLYGTEYRQLISTERVFSTATIKDDFDGTSVIVVLDRNHSGINRQHKPEFFRDVNIAEIEDLTFVANGRTLVDERNFEQVLLLTLPIDSKENVLDTIRKLEKIEGIKYAGPNRYRELEIIPNDPLYTSQIGPEWGQWGLEKIQAPQAWNFTTGSHTVRVGIIDSGIGNAVGGRPLCSET